MDVCTRIPSYLSHTTTNGRYIKLMLRRIKWDQQREENDMDQDNVRACMRFWGAFMRYGPEASQHRLTPPNHPQLKPPRQDDDDEDEEEHEAGASSGAGKTCELVWKGVVAKPAFTGFKFQVGGGQFGVAWWCMEWATHTHVTPPVAFTHTHAVLPPTTHPQQETKTITTARKVLESRGVVHYFDMVVNGANDGLGVGI